MLWLVCNQNPPEGTGVYNNHVLLPLVGGAAGFDNRCQSGATSGERQCSGGSLVPG
jgi:hypothetical protein